ncbi:TIGR04219 family outer membrane beta-barrel protein [Thiomicrospira microaerophila]|uniref:TIGR04219 family outer membrane beta-barrel protein n=1 Tax=Thiomicrospira microaerophila TaxID=406020 RepID=UPI0005C98925|nr:TIGR04219 family outer membrane beta-barrel protein [Thiomicrospira microaerophila]
MKKTAYGLIALLTAGSAHAELLGAGVGGGIWHSGPTGTVTTSGSTFNLEKDAGLSAKNNNYLWAYFNHPLPLVPNFRAEFTSTSTTGTGTVSSFSGTTLSGKTQTNLDLDQTDFLLYWGLPLPFIRFNYGFGAKDFKGELSVKSDTASPTPSNLNATLPVGYLGADFSLPMLPLTLSANTKTLGSRFNDTSFKARYDIIGFGLKLGAEAGYRTINLDSSDLSNLNVDLSYGGVFAGVTLVF